MIQKQKNELIFKASKILSTIDPNQRALYYQQLYAIISDYKYLPELLQITSISHQFLFVFCQILTQLIIKQKYINIQNLMQLKIMAVQEQYIKQISNQIECLKKNTYGLLINMFYQKIRNNNLPSHLVRQSINLVSVCLKCQLQDEQTNGSFQSFLNLYFNGFKIEERMSNNFTSEITLIYPQMNTFPENYEQSIKILISLIQNITCTTYFNNYYQYRKSIYIFRNHYLYIILQITISYFKFLLNLPQNNSNSKSLLAYLKITIQLVDTTISYPYSLNIHDYQSQDQMRQYQGGQIFFPNYFRNLTNDQLFLHQLSQLYLRYASSNSIDFINNQMKALLRCFIKIASANYYYFDTMDERKIFRKNMVLICQQIITSFQYYETYFTTLHLDFILKIFNSYGIVEYQQNYLNFISVILNFLEGVVQFSEIQLQLQENSPISKSFQILKLIWVDAKSLYIKQLMQSQVEGFLARIRISIQKILQLFLARISDSKTANNMVATSFKNYQKQVKCYTTFFQNVPPIFTINLEQNLQILYAFQIQNLSNSSQIVWTYLLAFLLNEQKEDIEQQNLKNTQYKAFCVIKIFNFVKTRNNISDMKYLQVMANKIFKIEKRQISSGLWKKIVQITQSDIDSLIIFLVQKCIKNFNLNSENLIEYSIDLLNYIYSRIKMLSDDKFNIFSKYIQNIIYNLDKTVFQTPIYYKKRIKLFQMLSSLWLSESQHKPVYQLYNIARKSLIPQPSLNNLLKYMYDITGLTRSLQHKSAYLIIVELFIRDFKQINNIYFAGHKASVILKQPVFFKAFINMVSAIISDYFRRLGYTYHTPIPLELQHIFYDILKSCIKFEYGKKFLILLNKFVMLPSFKPALSLPPKENCYKQNIEFQRSLLVCNYFEQIHRIQNLDQIYGQILDNVDYLYMWYEQAISRKLDLNIWNFRLILESKLWKNAKEKQKIGKILYMMGNYNQRYKLIPEIFVQNESETQFILRFVKYFKSQ